MESDLRGALYQRTWGCVDHLAEYRIGGQWPRKL